MAQIERVNYDSYIKPLEHIQKAHNDTLADMANMSQQSEILDYYLDPNLDKESYNLYNNFKQEFNNQANDFARNGLTRSNGTKLLNLHRNYNNNVMNVLDAVKKREERRAEQHKLMESSKGQAIFGENGFDANADNLSVDHFLRGGSGYAYQNLNEVHDEAKNFAKAASERHYGDNYDSNAKILNNEYWHLWEETGYNDQEAYNILKGLLDKYDDPTYDATDESHPAGFVRNIRMMLQERDFNQFSDYDKNRMVMAYMTGIDEGLTHKKTHKELQTEENRLKVAKAGKTNVNVKVGGDGKPTADVLPQTNGFYDLQFESSFDDPNNPGWFTSFFNNNRSALYKKLYNDNSPFVSSETTVQPHVNDDGTETRGNRLLTREEYVNLFDDNSMPYYSAMQDPEKIKNERGNEYDELIADLKKTFYLTDADIKKLTNPKDYNHTLNKFLEDKDNEIESWKDGVKARHYVLNIRPENKGMLISQAFNRDAKAFGRITLNPFTKEYSYKDKNVVSKKDLEDFLKNTSDIKESTDIGIVYAPIGRDIYQVYFKNQFLNDGEPVYVPLSAFGTFAAGDKVNELAKYNEAQKQLLNDIESKLKGNPNDKKLQLAKKLAEYDSDLLFQKILNTAATYADYNIKPHQIDMDEDAYQVDAETGKKIEKKNKNKK